MKRISTLLLGLAAMMMAPTVASAVETKNIHVEGRYLKDDKGNIVNLHGFAQTYSPWFNEQGKKWSNYDVAACLRYNKEKIDEMERAGWKHTFIRLHMDPYWSNLPGVQTTGENDISAFDFNRFKTYLAQVFIPMAEYALSKGMHVVMRPPGVCPEDIAVGDAYQSYLKKVWNYVAIQPKLKNVPGISFELANEPVNILGDDGRYASTGDSQFKNLTKFFQDIVDGIRAKGCNNILWIPGTGYQSHYEGYAAYPIKGENIGYAVHVYPGWYGSDALKSSVELGGNYGGGFVAFQNGWDAQIKPVADFAPILVTEMDWAPGEYNASWGKSLTGKMFGTGFGANFKTIADNSGNVSWLIFTGADILGRFKDTPGTAGKYDVNNDPQACPWPTYHWYKDYLGEKLPDPTALLIATGTAPANSTEYVMMSGTRMNLGLVGVYADGYENDLIHRAEVTVTPADGPITYSSGRLTSTGDGEAKIRVKYSQGTASIDKTVTVRSSMFPLVSGYFNPSIWDNGSFNQMDGTCKTGQYGFAGWHFPAGIDLSAYRYLIAEIEAPCGAGLSFRVYDQNNYWSDPAMVDFNGGTRAIMQLNNMVSDKGRRLTSKTIHYVGFWSTGSESFRIKRVYAANSTSGLDAVEAETLDPNAPVDVYTLQGVRVRTQVPRCEAAADLPTGLYVIGRQKVYVP